MLIQGRHDTVTTIGSSEYIMAQSDLPRDRYLQVNYDGGHMLIAQPEVMLAIRAFVLRAEGVADTQVATCSRYSSSVANRVLPTPVALCCRDENPLRIVLLTEFTSFAPVSARLTLSSSRMILKSVVTPPSPSAPSA